jgi:steroid 5-alpha reductase family enzyme
MTETLLTNLAVSLIFITLAYGIAFKRRRLDTVDIAWGIGFMCLAWSSWLQHNSGRSLLLAALVSLWGARLAFHIGQRSLGSPTDDRRYTELTKKWRGSVWIRAYFSIFVVQGLLVWLVGLPLSLATRQQLHGLAWLSVVGAIVWLVGFAFESIADRQLRDFLRRPNHPKNMEEGLWRFSRHPNYFGELTQWWGIGIVCLQVSYGWVGLFGPLTLTYLIVFVSGLPPIERHRAKDPAYRAYQQRVSPLIPLPPRRTGRNA